jgi:glutathione S-transferase
MVGKHRRRYGPGAKGWTIDFFRHIQNSITRAITPAKHCSDLRHRLAPEREDRTNMTVNAEQFILRTTLTSPYGRKVRMAAEALRLTERIVIQHTDTYDEKDTIRQQNPLGKMPCLVRADGSAIFDSSVILEFLQHVAGSEQLLPLQGDERFRLLTLTRQADGIIDAGALVMYENRYHEPEQISEKWLSHQRGKIRRALSAFESAPPDSARTDAVTITLACALGFLDKRKPMEWRPICPRLVGWFERFIAHEPAFDRTRPPSA